jgi:hypothetical protein
VRQRALGLLTCAAPGAVSVPSSLGITQNQGTANTNPYQFTGRENDATGFFTIAADTTAQRSRDSSRKTRSVSAAAIRNDASLAGNLATRVAFHQNPMSDLRPLHHVAIHTEATSLSA